MRPVTIILVVMALLAAGGAGIFAKKAIDKKAREAVAAQADIQRDVEVLVAARDIAQGSLLKEIDLRWDRWPIGAADPLRVFIRQEGRSGLAHLPGNALRRNVIAGEPLSGGLVFHPGKNAGLMPGMISPGKRAVGITVTAASTASGFVLPGDLVDVILTIDMKKQGSDHLPGGGRIASETVLTNVRVLAVDQEIARDGAMKKMAAKKAKPKDKPKDKEEGEDPDAVAFLGKTVALEVDPADAERLISAQATGTLSLALRGIIEGEEEPAPRPPFMADVNISKALRSAASGGPKIIKGGATTK